MTTIYLDESGDLGWKFDADFKRGGSSRYLTIAAAVIANTDRHRTGHVDFATDS